MTRPLHTTIPKETTQNLDKAIFTSVSAGIEYNYWVLSSLGIMLRATKSVWSTYEVKDTNNERIYKFNTAFEAPFISIGIKFNPIRKLQNSLNPQ